MDACRVNGRDTALVDASDRGLAYGDGLFETIAIRDGRPRFFDHHLSRLAEGCERLRLTLPPADLLRGEIAEVTQQIRHGVVKILLTRGCGERGYAPPEVSAPTRVVMAQATPPPETGPYRHGVSVRHCQTPITGSRVLAGLKTLNRLEQVMARAEWNTDEYAEGLMATPGGAVICGTMSNLFLVRDERLVTPMLNECGVRGVMRRVVLEVAAALKIPATEQSTTVGDVDVADELFLTNSLIGIWPIRRCARRSYAPGSLTRQLMAALAERGVEECRT